LSRCIQSSFEHVSSATALVASSSSTAAIAVDAGRNQKATSGPTIGFRASQSVLQSSQAVQIAGQIQPINAQQHPITEDLLLTQNNVNNPVPSQQRPNWAVVTTSSTATPIGGSSHVILTPTTLGGVAVANTITTALQPNAGNSSNISVNPNQNWMNSRPNSSSIHTPSPTNLVPLQPQQQLTTTTAGGPLGQHQPILQQHTVLAVTSTTTAPGRLPPPLAPITQATTQQPPSSLPPPAYTPPIHLSSSGFQASPHSSS